jgi:hypothetical protein
MLTKPNGLIVKFLVYTGILDDLGQWFPTFFILRTPCIFSKIPCSLKLELKRPFFVLMIRNNYFLLTNDIYFFIILKIKYKST